jgi:hypothetical protein
MFHRTLLAAMLVVAGLAGCAADGPSPEPPSANDVKLFVAAELERSHYCLPREADVEPLMIDLTGPKLLATVGDGDGTTIAADTLAACDAHGPRAVCHAGKLSRQDGPRELGTPLIAGVRIDRWFDLVPGPAGPVIVTASRRSCVGAGSALEPSARGRVTVIIPAKVATDDPICLRGAPIDRLLELRISGRAHSAYARVRTRDGDTDVRLQELGPCGLPVLLPDAGAWLWDSLAERYYLASPAREIVQLTMPTDAGPHLLRVALHGTTGGLYMAKSQG